MDLKMKRSMLLSMIVLGLSVGGGIYTASNSSAKSYAKISTNYKLSLPGNSRNVNFTGSKSLYSKAGTLRGHVLLHQNELWLSLLLQIILRVMFALIVLRSLIVVLCTTRL